MTLADDLKQVVYEGRAIAGTLGFRPHSWELVEVLNAGNAPGDASNVTIITAITEADSQPPRAHWLNDEELAVAGLGRGTVDVGPITPLFSGGGTDLSRLTGANLQTNDQLYLRCVGPAHPDGALYKPISYDTERTLRIVIRATLAANG